MAETAVDVTSLPRRIGRHEVLAFLASGGMSELFLGREPSGAPVVIKRILPHLTRQRGFVTMFLDEARIGSLLHHPNVVEVHELGQVGLDLFMVMELLEGENVASLVRRLLRRDERLAYGLAAYLIAEAATGLQAAHELHDEQGRPLGLVHRDVSPQNVFVTYDGVVKVLDFGIATASHRLSHTATGTLKGKFAYMSPEQCRGERVDCRSDVFSLGVVLYELTTQRRLFHRANELLVLKAVCEDPMARPSRDRPDYPPFLEDICLRALARDPAARYPTAQAMRDELVAATQLLLGPVSPRQALAAEMQRLFAERMAAKAQMIRHVRAGTDPGAMPVTEPDEGVVVPQAQTGGATPVATAMPTPAPPTHRGRIIGALVALAVFAAIAGVGLKRQVGGRSAVASSAAAAALERDVEPAAPAPVPAAPTPALTVAPLTPEIAVRIESTPTGGEVSVDGEVRGRTPMDLVLPQGQDRVLIEVRERGFTTARRTIRRDRDQRLQLELRRRKAPASRASGPAGFHRFD